MFPTHMAKRRELPWLLLTIVLLGFALRLYRISYQSLWWDEVKTIERSAVSFPKLINELLAKRHHLPLYFLFIKGWLQTGQSAFIARYFSLIWGVISVALIYQVGRRVAGDRVGQLAALLLAINPFHIWYSQEARMYTLLIAAVIAAHLFLLSILKKDAWLYWLGYALAMLTAVYTHLFSLLILVVHYIFLALHYRPLKQLFLKWIGYTAVVGAFFAVWGLLIMKTGGLQEATPPWIVGTTWYDPFLTLLSFSAGRTIDLSQPLFYLVLLVYLATMLIALSGNRLRLQSGISESKTYQTFTARLLLTWLSVPIILIFFVSLDWPGRVRKVFIYTDRYLIIVLPAMILLAAWGLNQLNQKKPSFLALALGLIIVGTLPSLYNNYFQAQYGREDWRSVADRLQSNALATDVIWSSNDQAVPLAYYLNEERVAAGWVVAPHLDYSQRGFEEEMDLRVSVMQSQGDRVWLVTQFYNNDLHGFPQQRNKAVQHAGTVDLQYAWMKSHFELVEDETFVGIRLSLFDLSVVKP